MEIDGTRDTNDTHKSDEVILKAVGRRQRALRRQAAQDAEAQHLVEQASEPRRAKLMAMGRDWREVNNGRTSKRPGDPEDGEPGTRKKRKVQQTSEDEHDDQVLPHSKNPRTYAHSKKKTATKYHRKVVDTEVQSVSDSDSSIDSRANSGSENEERPSDEDDDLMRKAAGMSERDLAELYKSEQVKVIRHQPTAKDLFNSDIDVVPARSSSGLSRSSSGTGDLKTASSHSRSSKKVSKRDEVFMKERARVSTSQEPLPTKPSTSARSSLRTSSSRPSSTLSDLSGDDTPLGSHHKEKDRLANDGEAQWPARIRLLHNDGVKIRLQNSTIKTIITEAIRCCEREMITSNAFPETGQREEFRARMAKRAIRLLRAEMKDNQDYEDAYLRAKRDSMFVHKIGELAVDRLSHDRSEIRAAAITQIAAYELGVGRKCEQRVAALLKANYFVYDGHWAVGKDEDTWVFESLTAYLNPAIIDTIKASWFSSTKTLGNQYRELYISSLPDRPNEKELTIPLVALAVTSVHAALSCWKTGASRAKVQRFKGELVGSVYQTFVTSLEGFKARKPAAFHRLMHTIYTSVCGTRGDSHEAEIGEDPLAVFDLDDV